MKRINIIALLVLCGCHSHDMLHGEGVKKVITWKPHHLWDHKTPEQICLDFFVEFCKKLQECDPNIPREVCPEIFNEACPDIREIRDPAAIYERCLPSVRDIDCSRDELPELPGCEGLEAALIWKIN